MGGCVVPSQHAVGGDFQEIPRQLFSGFVGICREGPAEGAVLLRGAGVLRGVKFTY